VLLPAVRDVAATLTGHESNLSHATKNTFALSTYQMDASFSGNPGTIDCSNCMIQLLTTLLKPAFYRLSPRGHASVRGRYELHECRHEGQEIVPSLVNNLSTAIRHVARLLVLRRDLARVYGILHERRAEEHGRFPVGIHERGLARPLDAREGGPGRTQGNAVA
jgi:hypothetical protein